MLTELTQHARHVFQHVPWSRTKTIGVLGKLHKRLQRIPYDMVHLLDFRLKVVHSVWYFDSPEFRDMDLHGDPNHARSTTCPNEKNILCRGCMRHLLHCMFYLYRNCVFSISRMFHLFRHLVRLPGLPIIPTDAH